MTLLRLAVQKKGRLQERSLKLLKECGISIDNGKSALKAVASNFPIEVLYLRNSDIPKYIEDGVADIGITGENVLIEKQTNIESIIQLGFSKCRLSLAVPKNVDYNGLEYFQNKRLATSYPNTLRKYLVEKGIKASIHEISGSVEIAPGIGLAEGICDLVSSGNTLFSNGLKEVEVLLESQAVLAVRSDLSGEAKLILEKLLFRLKAVLKGKGNKYILLNAPNQRLEQICNLLPGMKSPTIIPLMEEGWSSVHSVINEDKFWEVIDQLKLAGAEGILIAPIEKMVL